MGQESKEKNFGFRLSSAQFQILKDIAARQDRSVAAIIRRAIDDYIRNQRRST